VQKIARQNFGVFEGGGGKEKSLPPIFSPAGGLEVPSFFRLTCLVGPYQFSKSDVPAVKIGVRGWGRLFKKIFDISISGRAVPAGVHIRQSFSLLGTTEKERF